MSDGHTPGGPATALAATIAAKAAECGADLAGIARVADLKASPSHRIGEKLPHYDGVGTLAGVAGKHGAVQWPEGARSAVVLAVEHPKTKPQLDWWLGSEADGHTPGNLLLIAVVNKLADWLRAEHGLRCWRISYHVDHGGAYMKDAAVLAGLGCVGKNNLFLSPEFGPRQRLRLLLVDKDLPSAGPSGYDPCDGCPEPCRAACPQGAFPGSVYSPEEYGVAELPGRDGAFDRRICNQQMTRDVNASEPVSVDGRDEPMLRTEYCRACELSCVAGRR